MTYRMEAKKLFLARAGALRKQVLEIFEERRTRAGRQLDGDESDTELDALFHNYWDEFAGFLWDNLHPWYIEEIGGKLEETFDGLKEHLFDPRIVPVEDLTQDWRADFDECFSSWNAEAWRLFMKRLPRKRPAK